MITIDNFDCDDYIVEKSYSVTESPEFGGTEYKDAWWKKHRTVVRNRVAGTVGLAMTASAYSAFITHLQEHEGVEGDHSITLFVNNLNTTKTITAYVTVTSKVAIATKNFDHAPAFFSVKLKIEER